MSLLYLMDPPHFWWAAKGGRAGEAALDCVEHRGAAGSATMARLSIGWRTDTGRRGCPNLSQKFFRDIFHFNATFTLQPHLVRLFALPFWVHVLLEYQDFRHVLMNSAGTSTFLQDIPSCRVCLISEEFFEVFAAHIFDCDVLNKFQNGRSRVLSDQWSSIFMFQASIVHNARCFRVEYVCSTVCCYRSLCINLFLSPPICVCVFLALI